jgi:hypothetical protein
VVFSSDDGVTLDLIATKEVVEEAGWKRYRIVLVARAPAD